ncbi:hypothetical protein BDZ90DRAFT_234051 [Jaminaea rosea]|uniref:Uncharacterized protein n=1 Tax=Jaminaea rosea TaxID=1569628 RepID=A0A316UNY0_9BASI|nr:hypothetical protein BDZ90DRAFT_234051 [Jaminaea rosea]PWN25613.1 hypothetical protein BDZ90DRAFT_234051 [Jaminaea rosea]
MSSNAAAQREKLDAPASHYTQKSSVNAGMSAALTGLAAGTFVSAVQNSLGKHDRGALGIFTRTGSTVAFFTAAAGTFAFTDAMVANVRQEDGAMNAAAGGCAAGFVAGAQARSVPMMFGSCLALGTLMGTFRAAGDSLTGPYKEGLPLAAGGGDENQPDWRELRKERRNAFFKQPKETEESA